MDQPGSPAVLAFTLALAAGLAVAVCLTVSFASSGEAVTQEAVGQDPPYLSPDPETVTREEYTDPGIDVSAAAAADAQNVRGRLRAAAFTERFDTTEEPAALVASVTDELSARAEALDEQHAQLLATYSDDEISTGRLLRELVRQRAAAAAHRRLADRVEAAAIGSDAVNSSRAVREQSEALDDEILALESPVTDALADGQVDPRTTVYAQAGTDTLVLALTNRTHMQRQATLRDQRKKNAPNQFIQEAGENENANALAINRAEELHERQPQVDRRDDYHDRSDACLCDQRRRPRRRGGATRGEPVCRDHRREWPDLGDTATRRSDRARDCRRGNGNCHAPLNHAVHPTVHTPRLTPDCPSPVQVRLLQSSSRPTARS